ncbi:MAG: VanZ family protein [Candidatus Omnitrophica bacterium]|nr:VanZ family protein [Candidatus Omnitrophota bacterium]
MPLSFVKRAARRGWTLTLLWMGVIFISSSLPGERVTPFFPHADKAAHFVIYGILGMLFSRSLHLQIDGLSRGRIWVITVLFCLLYGILDEWHQSFVPGRDVCALDVLFDALGGCAGGLWYHDGN